MLFDGLPKALGYDPLKLEDASETEVEKFAQALTETLREFKYCYPDMLDEQRRLFAQAFHLGAETPLDELRRTVIGRYAGLDTYTVDVDGLKAFIKRLTKDGDKDQLWFENILMFLGQRPSKKWSDADRAEAEIKLSDYSKRMLDLETLRLHYERHAVKTDEDFDVILLKSMKKGEAPIDEVVTINDSQREAVEGINAEIAEFADHAERFQSFLEGLGDLLDSLVAEPQEVP